MSTVINSTTHTQPSQPHTIAPTACRGRGDCALSTEVGPDSRVGYLAIAAPPRPRSGSASGTSRVADRCQLVPGRTA